MTELSASSVLTGATAGLVDGAQLSEVDRAEAVIATVERWLFAEPLGRLIHIVETSQTETSNSQRPETGWLHLNEDLPSWVRSVDANENLGLGYRQAQVLRGALEIERRVAESFNFRSRDGVVYRERSQAVAGVFSDTDRADVEVQSERLGLVTPVKPTRTSYDQTLILGGGYQSPLLRARLAKLLMQQGIDLGGISLLGSPRFMIEEPPEQASVENYAPEAKDEFDLMVSAACAEFGWCSVDVVLTCGCADTRVKCPAWVFASEATPTPPEYTHERIARIRDDAGIVRAVALSASTGRPPYRPDTADTLAMWSRHAKLHAGDHALCVTTQVFVPFQTFDALRRLYLPNGVNVDAVGFGADWGDRPQTAEYLLQETLSAIRSARRLLVSACETLRAP